MVEEASVPLLYGPWLRAPQGAPHVSELDGDIDWAGREIDFYRACARIVERLGWDEIEKTCGPRVRILADLVRDAHAHLASQAIPERLKVRDFKRTAAEHGRVPSDETGAAPRS
jgi:hypothetical protein